MAAKSGNFAIEFAPLHINWSLVVYLNSKIDC